MEASICINRIKKIYTEITVTQCMKD